MGNVGGRRLFVGDDVILEVEAPQKLSPTKRSSPTQSRRPPKVVANIKPSLIQVVYRPPNIVAHQQSSLIQIRRPPKSVAHASSSPIQDCCPYKIVCRSPKILQPPRNSAPIQSRPYNVAQHHVAYYITYSIAYHAAYQVTCLPSITTLSTKSFYSIRRYECLVTFITVLCAWRGVRIKGD